MTFPLSSTLTADGVRTCPRRSESAPLPRSEYRGSTIGCSQIDSDEHRRDFPRPVLMAAIYPRRP